MFLLVTIAAATTFAAAPGSLDPTFGIGGHLSRSLPGGGNIYAAAAQADGKIVLAGAWQTGSNRDFIIVRINPDGSYDNSFGNGGIVYTDFGGSFDDAHAVVVQPDGKIVAAGGRMGGAAGDSVFARYLSNGLLDTTFDGDGMLVLGAFSGQTGDSIQTLSIQSDGKIVGGGSVSGLGFLLVRINTSGSLDQTFGNGGVAVSGQPTFVGNMRDMVVLPDGKFLGAGGSGRCVVTRFNQNGSVDPAFGAGGFFVSDIGYYNVCSGIDVEPSGRILLSGTASPSSPIPQYSSFIARLNPLGTLDNTFGGDGFVDINVNPLGADNFTDVHAAADGRVIATGFSGDFPEYDFSICRFNANGTPDTTFGREGTRTALIGGDDITEMSIVYGDKVISIGYSQDVSAIRAARFNLAVTPTSTSDFDGDGLPDYAVFRPSTGVWFVLRSSDNGVHVSPFGASGDVPVDGDFDGDGRTDLAIFRPSVGQWWVNLSSSGAAFAVQFGQNTDRPAVGDYDKDGRTDIAFWRPSTGTWTVLRSSDGFTSYFGVPFGVSGDIPIGAAPQ